MSRQKRRLVNYVINPKYQAKFVLMLVGSAVLSVIGFVAVFLLSVKKNYDLLIALGPAGGLANAQLRMQLSQTFENLALSGFAFILLIALFGLIISHRTAGALYRYKKVFEAIRAGDSNSRINCRPNDDFLDVADSFNQMMNDLQKNKT